MSNPSHADSEPTDPTPEAPTDHPSDPDQTPETDTTPPRETTESDQTQNTQSTEQTREYIQIRPTDDPLSVNTVESHLRRLHKLETTREESLLRRLLPFTANTPPTIECLLIADQREPLQYLFGIDDPESLDALERILRGLLPEAYELERREKTPTDITATIDPDTDALEAVTFQGNPERASDWQTCLTPFRSFTENTKRREAARSPSRGSQTKTTPQSTTATNAPLTTVVETMAASETPIVYQALLQPKPDWSSTADQRRLALEAHQDTIGDQLVSTIAGPPDEDVALQPSDRNRLEELDTRETRRSFVVNARLVLGTPDDTPSTKSTRELTSAFAPVSHTCYEIQGSVSTGKHAHKILQKIQNRTLDPPTYGSLRDKLPFTRPRSNAIIADPREAPNFCLLGGDALTAAGARAVSPTPGERSALPRPPVDQLDAYRGPGLTLGHPLTQDGTADPEPIALPEALQPLHVGWFGKTGSGKSTSLINAILANHGATDGASILIDRKGDGMAEDYLRAHYAEYGSLDDVLYFNCGETLPAFSFFDIRDELAAGISRTTAVEDRVDHYIEMLTQIMGTDRFEQAVRSPDIIRYLTKAMFDPVNGTDAFAHRDLHETVRTMHERQSAPAVADEDLERMLAGVVANRTRSFDEIMQGVANRMEKIPVDQRLARIFNHVPEEGDPHFDLADNIDDDVVIIVDTGELRSEAQRVLTLVVLSNLWTALRRRAQRSNGESEPENQDDSGSPTESERALDTETPDQTNGALSDLFGGTDAKTATDQTSESDQAEPTEPDTQSDTPEYPLVNLYVEEAASIAVSDLLQELLAQSRSFGCSVTLAMQFPGQLRRHGETAYEEVLNNVSTIVTGNVPADRRLAERLATDDMSPQAVSNRLRALRRGQWFASLPAKFDRPEPRPFLLESLDLPPGDPAGPAPLTTREEETFQSASRACRERTRSDAGVSLARPSTTAHDAAEAETETTHTDSGLRVDSALPHTNRLPPTVRYLDSIHGLECTECTNRYDPSSEGMTRAIECCSSLDAVDRDDVPICELNLKLTPEEREASEWSDRQLMFCQAVYNAQQLRYDPLEYDLCQDSMIRLQEYVGIDSDAVQDLMDGDLCRHDTDHPHRLYSVTPEGRAVIGESYRLGVDYGHGKGDLEESSEHVFMVEVGRQFLVQEYVADPDSPVEEIIPYYDLTRDETLSAAAFMGSDEAVAEAVEDYEQRRLDLAGVDADGDIVVALEAERINHDYRRAVPDDFDKIAACDVDEAIWVVMSQSAAHDVLQALNEPADGEPRVEKTYAETSPPQKFRIDTPGLTAMYPSKLLRNRVIEN